MLGYTESKNNDVYLFLTPNEIIRLDNEIIQGTHFGFSNNLKKAVLELVINDNINDLIHSKVKLDENKNITYYIVELRRKEYEILIERNGREFHEQYGHFFIINTDFISFKDRLNYLTLCEFEKNLF